jgi:hypothetical protein
MAGRNVAATAETVGRCVVCAQREPLRELANHSHNLNGDVRAIGMVAQVLRELFLAPIGPGNACRDDDTRQPGNLLIPLFGFAPTSRSVAHGGQRCPQMQGFSLHQARQADDIL